MAIPAGCIIAWPGTAGSIPAGFTRCTSLDASHTQGAAPGSGGGGTGGSLTAHVHDATHGHGTIASHTHGGITSTAPTGTNSTLLGGSTSPLGDDASHTHAGNTSGSGSDTSTSTSTSWSSVSIEPAWYGVIWIQSNGTPTGIPVNAVCWWNGASAPTSFTQHAASEGLYLKGAAPGGNGGTTGGSNTPHTHSSASHGHNSVGHTHTSSSGAPSFDNDSNGAGAGTAAAAGHVHSVTVSSATEGSTSTGSGATSGTAVNDPPFTTLLAIAASSAAAPLGIICLWLGSLASVPSGWALCDGSAGTPDLRSRFIRAAVAGGGDVGTVGGASTHSHSNGTTHSHDANGHTHAATLNSTGTSSSPLSGSTTTAATPTHTHTTSLATTGTVTGAYGATALPVGTSTDTRPPYTNVVYIQLSSTLTLSITAPTVGQVETTLVPPISWALAVGHTQAQRQVQIYASDGVTLVYDSGVVSSSTQSMTLPAGYLHNSSSYYLYVNAWDTGGLEASGGPVPFSTSVTTPPLTTVAGLSLLPVPYGKPPYVFVSWTAPTIPGGDTFQFYSILRRFSQTTTWTTIATIATPGTTTYNDYTACPGQAYDYAVLFTDLSSGVLVSSLPQSPAPAVILNFLGVWVHSVNNPSLCVLYKTSQVKGIPVQDQVAVPVWGRQQPTWHIGQLLYTWTQFTGVPTLFPYSDVGPLGPNPTPWQITMRFAQAAASGGIVCVRFGNQCQKYYGIVDLANMYSSLESDTDSYIPTITIQESFLDEAVGGGSPAPVGGL